MEYYWVKATHLLAILIEKAILGKPDANIP